MALSTEGAIFLFLLTYMIVFLENNVICSFCLAKCISKGKTNNSFWLHEEWLSPQRAIILFLLPDKSCFLEKNVKIVLFAYMPEWLSSEKEQKNFVPFWLSWRSRKERLFVLFSLQNTSEKGKKNCSFWLHEEEEWLSSQKEHFFVPSECHLSRKEGHLYFFPYKMHQKRTKTIVPFDCMMLKNNVICTFCLAKCIRKGKQICSFWLTCRLSRKERHLYFLPCQMHQKRTNKIVPFDYMKNGSHHKKSIFFCSFLNVIFLEKKVICTFCLAKCIRKGQKNVPFDYMMLKKNVICTFFLTKCIRKGQKKMFLLTAWRMALSTQRTIFLFLS